METASENLLYSFNFAMAAVILMCLEIFMPCIAVCLKNMCSCFGGGGSAAYRGDLIEDAYAKDERANSYGSDKMVDNVEPKLVDNYNPPSTGEPTTPYTPVQ